MLKKTPRLRLVSGSENLSIVTGLKPALTERRHPEHAYRACLGLLSLVKRYGKPRLEVACLIALELGTTKFSHVRDILASGRDRLAPVMTTEWTSPEHANVRGPGHYQ